MFAKRFAHRLNCSDISGVMYSIQILFSYLFHRLRTLSVPVNNSFIHEFEQHVLNKKIVHPGFSTIEKYRSCLVRSTDPLQPFDIGAGTKSVYKRRTIGNFARVASVNKVYGQLLFRLVNYYMPNRIIELGTALGISTMYLALGNADAEVTTVEANPQLAGIAAENFHVNGFNNITVVNNTFDRYIAGFVPDNAAKTLIFIDGNHSYEATLQYYKQFGSIPGSANMLIFDDINWSHEMAQAWKSITGSAVSGVKIDLFHMGILFQGIGIDPKVYRLFS